MNKKNIFLIILPALVLSSCNDTTAEDFSKFLLTYEDFKNVIKEKELVIDKDVCEEDVNDSIVLKIENKNITEKTAITPHPNDSTIDSTSPPRMLSMAGDSLRKLII